MSKKKIEVEIEWFDQDDFPEELGENGFSVDVLVYIPSLNEYSVGWFEYKTNRWLFLSNQDYKNEVFFWRFFYPKTDIPGYWLDIKNYEGLYKISNTGNVASFHNNKYNILKPSPTKKGYLQVKLSKKVKIENKYVARLVAEHFIDNPKNLPEVNHIDEDKSNNFFWNLEWCDRQYNMNYGDRTNKASISNKKAIVRSSKNGDKKEYNGICDVVIDGFIPSCVQRCCSGERKTHKGYFWNYKN